MDILAMDDAPEDVKACYASPGRQVSWKDSREESPARPPNQPLTEVEKEAYRAQREIGLLRQAHMELGLPKRVSDTL